MINISSEIQFLLLFALVALIVLFSISFLGLKLAKQNGGDIRAIWYFFSLAFISTGVAIIWASSVGAVDSQGSFQGDLGAALNKLLKFMLDLDADLKIFFSILSITLFPQFISYILSGLFGCASAPLFVGESIRLFIWGVVKSFVVAAGIILSFSLYGYFNNWIGWDGKGATSMSSMSGLLLMESLFILYLYHDIYASLGKPLSHRFSKLKKTASKLQRWFTRKHPTNLPRVKKLRKLGRPHKAASRWI